jgi:hypothetical protein
MEWGSSLPCRVSFGLLAPGKSPHGHVHLHHGAFLQFVPNGVRVIGTGCLKKLVEVVSRLPCPALEIALSSGDELLIGVTNILIIVTLVTDGSVRDSLGPPLQPPFVACGTPLHTLVSCLGWYSSTIAEGYFPAAPNENGTDHLLT